MAVVSYVKSNQFLRPVTLCTVLLASCQALFASELSVTVLQSNGRPLPDAVVDVVPAATPAPLRTVPKAVIDQRDLMFVPETLIVRTGTEVSFPNSDNVLHQVYSFSTAKRFQLSLYSRSQHAMVTFDKPGLVTVGCNIHDGMFGYIYVTDSPWFGATNDAGIVQIGNLPAGNYTIKIWHSRIKEKPEPLNQQISVSENGSITKSIRLTKPVNAPLHQHGSSKSWEDY
jgi:plastocyanin